MDTKFWHEKWESNHIGFHRDEPNPLLIKYFHQLALPRGSRVFVPFCGKTRDMVWLRAQGYRVVGSELVLVAIEQLVTELGLEARWSDARQHRLCCVDGIDIWVGDFFDLSRKDLGPIDAVYDRAALVALPAETRKRYAAHMQEITNCAPQLVLCYEYDQNLVEGPPFSVIDAELKQHYEKNYELVLLESEAVPGGLKEKYPALEKVWLLQPGAADRK